MRIPFALALCGLCLVPVSSRASAADLWAIPPEGACEAGEGLTPANADAVPPAFRVGETLDEKKAAALKDFVPEELWANRERFFYEGMQLEIGPCYRDYRPPDFFEQATKRFHGQARLSPEGELENYRAGLPFDPDSIDPEDPQAALRWAWNWISRYQAGGSFADGVRGFVWYLDLQTLTPLYYAAYRDDTAPGGLGFFVGRWSEDRADYPRWPGEPTRPVRVIDPVGSALIDWNDQDSVRSERWNTVSIPRDEKKLARMISESSLRGH